MEAVSQSLGNTFAFIVASTRADRVNVTPANCEKVQARQEREGDVVTLDSANENERNYRLLVFRLGMDFGISINLYDRGNVT